MHILTLTTLPQGGATNAARQLHRALCAHGHTGVFACLEAASAPAGQGDKALSLTGEAAPEEAWRWTSRLLQHWSALSEEERCREGLCELYSDTVIGMYDNPALDALVTQADIVHLHWMAGLLYSPRLFLLLQGKKVVWTFHDMNPFTGGCHYHVTCRRFEVGCGHCPALRTPAAFDTSALQFRLKQALYPTLNLACVTPSHWLAELASGSPLLADASMATIPNAHDTNLFRPMDRDRLRGDLGIPESTFVVLLGAECHGSPRKNMGVLPALVSRFQETPNHAAGVLFLTYGYGEAMPAGDLVRHMGPVSQETLAELYNVADVFLNPSLLDNLPNTLCEAQCCGTPVLAYDAGGSGETFVDGHTGLLVAHGLEPLVQVLQSQPGRETLAAMRHAARRFAEQAFSPDVVARQYTALYEQHLVAPFAGQSGEQAHQLLLFNALASLATMVKETYTELARHTTRVEEQLGAETLHRRLEALQQQVAALECRQRHLESSLHAPFWKKVMRSLRRSFPC